MPTVPLKVFKPKTPLARLRRVFLFHKDGTRFYQGNLGDDLGVKAVRIQQFELGTRPLPEKHALKLQEIYGISAAWLLGGNPKAKPVTPEGKPYSRKIAYNCRLSHRIRHPLSQEPTANLAWHLALSLEALLSEIRAAIIRTNQEKGLTEAAVLFDEIRDAVIPSLKTAPPLKTEDPPPSIATRLHSEAERQLENPTPEEFWRLDLTRQCLGVDEHPIAGAKGKEQKFEAVPPSDKTIEFPDKALVVGPSGKVIETRPMTPEEAIKYQPGELRPPEPAQEERKRVEDSPSPPMDDQEREVFERELLRLRQEYHLMDDNNKLWEEWRPKLERLALKRLEKRRSALRSPKEA